MSSFISIGDHISSRWIPYSSQPYINEDHINQYNYACVPLDAAVHLGLLLWAPKSIFTSIEGRVEHEVSTSFFLAVRGGHDATAELLRTRNPDLKYSDEWGRTELDHAAGSGPQRLLGKMCSSNTQTDRHACNSAPRRDASLLSAKPLYEFGMSYDIEQRLVKARTIGPDAFFRSLLRPSARDSVLERFWEESGLAPAMCPGLGIESAGVEKLQGLRQCLEQGIILAVLHDFRGKDYLSHGCNQIVRALLAAGANPNPQGQNGRTALHEALTLGEHDIVLQLSRANRLNPNVRDYDGNTALHEAFSAGRLEDVKLLSRIPSLDPDQQDKEGRTALFICAVCGYADMFKTLLMDCHADPNIATSLGLTVWNWPLKCPEICSILEEYKKKNGVGEDDHLLSI